MREIKFRGKRIDNGEWVFGYFTTVDDKAFIQEQNPMRYPPDDEVVIETIGQYTGLHDKNGVEIYEGDEVVDERGNKAYIAFLPQEMGYVLVFEKRDSRLGHRTRGGGYDLDFSLEVIGTIHDKEEVKQ